MTIAVDFPRLIFSLFSKNMATEAPLTTPGANAEAYSHNKMTFNELLKESSRFVRIRMRHTYAKSRTIIAAIASSNQNTV